MTWAKLFRIIILIGRMAWPLIEPMIFSSKRDARGRMVRRRRWLFRRRR
jgi:DMSO/TMAO reductase YedYZ heme-binding membrane subunit